MVGREMNSLATYFIKEILNLRKRPFKNADKLFFDRVRRKLNEQQPVGIEELNKLKKFYEYASDPKRLKW